MTKHAPSKGPSQRQLRVGELIRHALAEVFVRADFADPDLKGALITVSEVKVSPDMRHATAFVAPLAAASAEASEKVIKALNRRHRFFRGELAGRVDLKFAPDLEFRLDESFEQSQRIDALLRSPDVARDLD